MSEFVLHPEAVKDLEEIWEYIAAENLDAADRVREEIYDAIQSLVPFPYVGHSRSDLTSRPLRFQVVREYVIAYAAEEKPASDHRHFAWKAESASDCSDAAGKDVGAKSIDHPWDPWNPTFRKSAKGGAPG